MRGKLKNRSNCCRRIKQQRFEILGEKADEFRYTRITEKTFRLWKN